VLIQPDLCANIPVAISLYGKPLNSYTIIQALPLQSWGLDEVSVVRDFSLLQLAINDHH